MKKTILLFTFLITALTYSQDNLPNVSLTTLDGKAVNMLEVSTNEKPVVISLWATWCVPCIKELDAISDVYKDWKAETDFELIAVSVDDSRTAKRVKPMVNGKGWDYTILLDKNHNLKRALGASTVPLVLLVVDNKVVYKHSGYSPGSENDLFEKIKQYAK